MRGREEKNNARKRKGSDGKDTPRGPRKIILEKFQSAKCVTYSYLPRVILPINKINYYASQIVRDAWRDNGFLSLCVHVVSDS